MTDKERFTYEMMSTIELSSKCRKLKELYQQYNQLKKMSKHSDDKKTHDENCRLYRKYKALHKDALRILEKRQMKLPLF